VTIRRTAVLALAFMLALAGVGGAQQPFSVSSIPLFIAYDLEGAAANDAAIVADTLIIDSTSYTVIPGPDQPRPIVLTITDADSSISAGTVTIVGTKGDGSAVTATAAMTGGSGVKTLSYTGNWKSVTSVSNGVVTGEAAGDNIKVGTSSTIPMVYPITRGVQFSPVQVDTDLDVIFQPKAPFVYKSPSGAVDSTLSRLITTSGSSATVVSKTASSGALTYVVVGDVIKTKNAAGYEIYLGVIAKASNDSITVDRAVTLPTAGVSYEYKQLQVNSDVRSGWFSVNGATDFTVQINFDAFVGTAATLKWQLECRAQDADPAGTPFIAIGPITATSGTSAALQETGAWASCRIGLQWTAGSDNADAAAENISAYLTVRR